MLRLSVCTLGYKTLCAGYADEEDVKVCFFFIDKDDESCVFKTWVGIFVNGIPYPVSTFIYIYV